MPIRPLKIDATKSKGSRALQAIAMLREARDRILQIKDEMDEHADGVTWTTLAAEFGATNAGEAQVLYNLFAGAVPHFRGNAPASDDSLKQMMARVGN